MFAEHMTTLNTYKYLYKLKYSIPYFGFTFRML